MEQNYFELLDLNIEFLNLRQHTQEVLKKYLIHKIGDLISIKFHDMLKFEGINEYYGNDILKKIHSFGLCFPDEIVKPKNFSNIIMGLKTYNLRKKFYILKSLGKYVEAYNVDIEILDLLPHEYDFLKSIGIHKIGNLVKKDRKFIESYFNSSYKYSSIDVDNCNNVVRIAYNKIINQVHLLGLNFSDEKDIYNSDKSVRIFNTEYFK